jgi:hypothetical protein
MKAIAFAISVHALVTASIPDGGQPAAVGIAIILVIGMALYCTKPTRPTQS